MTCYYTLKGSGMFKELLVEQDAAQEARQAASIPQTRGRDVDTFWPLSRHDGQQRIMRITTLLLLFVRGFNTEHML